MNVHLRQRMEKLLEVDSAQKPAIYLQICEGAQLADATYWLQLVFSAGIATLGLVLDSPAVIIGAMLISPLMNPIMAMGLALAVGDLYLGAKALFSLLTSTAVSIGLASALVWLLPFHSATQEILDRTAPNLLDLGIAILSGLAGSVLLVRRRSDNGAMALPGVAIAVALMPPLCVVGFGVGSSFSTPIMSGAALLFLTNIVAIVASAFFIFLVVGMDTPAVRSQVSDSLETLEASEGLYRSLERRTHGVFGTIGKLRWRVAMLVILLAVLFVPLRAALIRVKNEAVARSAVQAALSRMVPASDVVTQQVQYSRAQIDISLFSTQPIEPARVTQAEQYVREKSGLKTTIGVHEVASRKDLAELASRFAAPVVSAPPAPKPTVATESAKLSALLATQMASVLPPGAPFIGYEWQLGANSQVTLQLAYTARQALDPLSVAVLQQTLRTSLGMPQLLVAVKRTAPVRATSTPLANHHRNTKSGSPAARND